MPPYTHGHTHAPPFRNTLNTHAQHTHISLCSYTHISLYIYKPPYLNTHKMLHTSLHTHPCTHAEARAKALIIRSLLHRKLHSTAQGRAKEGLPRHLFSPSMFSDSQAVPVFLPSSDKCLSAYQGCRALLRSPSSIF